MHVHTTRRVADGVCALGRAAVRDGTTGNAVASTDIYYVK